jgi:bacterioferritin-associated ferredoxin
MKVILCPCEDITRQEVLDAVAHGYQTMEDIKRYTGLATGSCQGRLCLGPCLELLVSATGRPAKELGLIRFRPPSDPVPLGLLAAGAKEEP